MVYDELVLRTILKVNSVNLQVRPRCCFMVECACVDGGDPCLTL